MFHKFPKRFHLRFLRIRFVKSDLGCVIDVLNIVYSTPQIRDPMGPINPEIMNIEVFGLSHNEIEKLLIQNEADQSYGTFGNVFS